MTKKVIVEPEAEEDLLDGAAWYEGQREGAGLALIAEADQVIASLGSPTTIGVTIANVDAPPHVAEKLRRFFLTQFSKYAVIYVVLDTEVRVIAISHGRKPPGYWLERLSRFEP